MVAGSAIKSYRDLDLWKVRRDLTVACYAATSSFPPGEL